MKIFAFILSFYILTLNCFPCVNNGGCNETYEQSISMAAPGTNHEHPSEACSPFCSCACCTATGVYQPVMYAKMIHLPFKPEKYFYLNDDFNSHDLHSIWQPPRFS